MAKAGQKRDSRYTDSIQIGKFTLSDSTSAIWRLRSFKSATQINEQTGEPYIRLPEPHANIVLTPPRPSDVPFTVQILNDVRVYRFLSGPPYPYRLEDAESWLKSIKAETDAVWKDLQDAARDDPDGRGPVKIVNGSPVRTIREQREDGTEVYLGDAEFRRHDFADVVHPEERARLKAENDAKEAGDPSIIWTIGDYLSPEVHGRGIMTAVIRVIISQWGVPRMGIRHLLPACLDGNVGSIKVFEKNGFMLRKSVPEAIAVQAKGDIPATRYTTHFLEWKAAEQL